MNTMLEMSPHPIDGQSPAEADVDTDDNNQKNALP
jgi:hypothetical protein